MAGPESGAPAAPTGTGNPANNGVGGIDARHRLARLVVVSSFLTIFLLVTALLSIAQLGSKEAAALAEKTFNVIIPVLAGWVGTVLAFYFSAKSTETTSQTISSALRGVTGPARSTKYVSDIMIPISSIRGLIKIGQSEPVYKTDGDVPFGDIEKRFYPMDRTTQPITRMIVMEDGKFKYLIHVSLVDRYKARVVEGASPPSSFDLSSPPTVRKLSDFIAHDNFRTQTTMLVAFAARDATLDQAKTALDATRGALDIIVTENGAPSANMMGWITDGDLNTAMSTG